jgi:membrane protein YdbS with pleckstrin-like domain
MNCGRHLPAEARFCADCGAPTDSELTRMAAPSVPPRQVHPVVQTPPAQEQLQPAHSGARPDIRRRDAQNLDDAERVIFNARPTLIFVGLGYVAAVIGAILLMALLGFTGWVTSWLIYVPLGLALLLIPAFYHLKRNLVRYTLTDSKIEIDTGFFSRRTRNIPLRNIQDVTVSVSLLQRLLGFGDIVIDDASEVGGQTVLDNIPHARRHADMLLRELRRWR